MNIKITKMLLKFKNKFRNSIHNNLIKDDCLRELYIEFYNGTKEHYVTSCCYVSNFNFLYIDRYNASPLYFPLINIKHISGF
jgi:hypothetical protein